MNSMIGRDGVPTPEFEEMIAATINSWIRHEEERADDTQFIVVAVQEKDGRKSYWGMVDVPNTPREDLYVEIKRRLYAAYRMIGQDKIHGFGILDVLAVLDRVELPQPPRA